jgi:hypothetical protein
MEYFFLMTFFFNVGTYLLDLPEIKEVAFLQIFYLMVSKIVFLQRPNTSVQTFFDGLMQLCRNHSVSFSIGKGNNFIYMKKTSKMHTFSH